MKLEEQKNKLLKFSLLRNYVSIKMMIIPLLNQFTKNYYLKSRRI